MNCNKDLHLNPKIAIFAVRPIIFAVRCMFVPTTNKQSPQKETGSESSN